MNKLVARFADGRVIKGTTVDFSTTRSVFHITESAANDSWDRTEINLQDLKALFFVKEYGGDPDHHDVLDTEWNPAPGERLVEVRFLDGECMVGTTPSYQPSIGGFFLIPTDKDSNNDRCFVVESAVRQIKYLC